MFTFGSGGSPVDPGHNATSETVETLLVNNGRTKMPNNCHLPVPQDPHNYSNSSIMEVAGRGGVINIVFNEVVEGLLVDMYLGMFYIGKITYGAKTKEELEDYFTEMYISESTKFYSRFRLEPHFKIWLVPIEMDLTGCWNKLVCPINNESTIGIIIQNAKECIKKEMNVVCYDDVVDSFFANGDYLNYLNDYVAEECDEADGDNSLKNADANTLESVIKKVLLDISVTVFFRLCGGNVIGEFVLPIEDATYREACGEMPCDVPMPMPVQSYDVSMLYFIMATGN